jgi:hypothetical protein
MSSKYYPEIGYASRSSKGRTVLMHKEIMNTPEGLHTDHIDCNSLNNQKSNLRIVTYSQNQANRKLNRDNTSGYKGVLKIRNKFLAGIKVNQVYLHLGTFDNPFDAARAYDEAAKTYFGNFARLNLG